MAIAINPQTGEVMALSPEGEWKPAQIAVNPQTNEKLAHDGNDWVPVKMPEAKPRTWGDTLSDTIRAGAEGATQGWSQELFSKIDELRGLGKYEDLLKEKEAQDAAMPIGLRMAGNVGGALLTAGAGGAALSGTALGEGVSALPNLIKYPALGAIEGGITGAGQSPDNRLGGAAVGTGLGLGTGVAAPYVGRGVANVYNRLTHAAGPEANQAASIALALERDKDTPQAILGRLQEAQQTRPGFATLGDVGKQAMRDEVQRIAQTAGGGRANIVPRMEARQGQQAIRLGSDLKELTGTSVSTSRATELAMADQKAAATPLYKQAMDFYAFGDPKVLQAFRDETSRGFGKAMLQNKVFKRILESDYGVNDIADAPSMALIDAWKKAGDQMANKAGRGTPVYRSIYKTIHNVLEPLDEANPAYKAARNAYAGPAKFMEQLDEGKRILSSNSDEMIANFNSLSDGEKDAFRIGAVQAIVAKMGSNPTELADMTRLLRSPEMRAKVAAIMPSNKAAQTWLRRLEFETSSSKLAGAALKGSQTALRQSQQKDAEDLAHDLVLGVITGHGHGLVGFAKALMEKGALKVRDTVRSRADAKLAELLTDPKRANDLYAILGGMRPPPPDASKLSTALTIGGTNALTSGGF